MNIKKITAALITAAMALSMTACAENGEPSTTTPSNSGGDIFDNNETSVSEPSDDVTDNEGEPAVSEPSDDVTDNEDEPAVSEPPKEVTMWDVIPTIPMTDASAFEYKYDSDLGGMVVTNYLRESPKVRISDTLEGEPVVKVDFEYLDKDITELVMPNTVKSFSLSDTIKESIEFINIPDSVTVIGEDAFLKCTSLKGIYIGNGVTEISDHAFNDCTSLTSVIIPDSVTKIGDMAFALCTSLTSITIPDSVTEIGSSAFYFCVNLTNINVAEGNSEFCLVDGVLYSKDKLTLKLYPSGRAESTYSISDDVTEIGDYAFFDCTSLTSITIPDSVTEIGDDAFSECTSLTSINIPDSVTKIGDSAFWNCTSLTSVTIPNSVTVIGGDAFWGCTSLTSVTIPDSVTEISVDVFVDCTSLTSATYKGKTYSYDNIDDLYAAINGD